MARKLPPGFVEILRQVNAEGTLPFRHRMKEAWRRYKTQSKRYAMRKTINPKLTPYERNHYLLLPAFRAPKKHKKSKRYHRCPGCGGLFRGKVCPVCINPKHEKPLFHAAVSGYGYVSALPLKGADWGFDNQSKYAIDLSLHWTKRLKSYYSGLRQSVSIWPINEAARQLTYKNPRKKKLSHPVSERQRRWAFAAEKRGELKRGTARKWSRRIKRKKKNPIAIYNPHVETRIPATNIAISYRRSSGDHIGKWFRHSFGKTVSMYGLDNGAIMLRSNQRKKLWGSVD